MYDNPCDNPMDEWAAENAKREKRLAARRAYYAENKDRINARRKKRKEELRAAEDRRQKELADKLQMKLEMKLELTWEA
jgi:uncharacterized membrane-anchored protein